MRAGNFRAVVLAVLVFLIYAYFVHTAAWNQIGFNVAIRFLLVKSLVEDRSFVLDKYQHLTDDKAYYEGRYYCDKPPGISYFAFPAYWVLRRAGDVLSRDWSPWPYLYLIRVIVISFPAAFFIVVLYRFLARFGVSASARAGLVAAYAMGTMAFPYATVFLAHQLAAVLVFSAVILLVRAGEGERRLSLYAGLAAGGAFAAEYQVAVIILVVAVLMLPLRTMRGRRGFFFLGLLPGIAAVLSYNYICFDNPLSMGYAHVAVPAAKETQAHGFLGVGLPSLEALSLILFSSFRGLFYISPFCILAVPGFFYIHRCAVRDPLLAALFRVCLTSVVVYLLFTSSYAAWQGGSAYGPRMMTPALPFLIIPIAFLLRRGSRAYGVLFAVTAAYSIVFNLVAVSAEPRTSEYLINPVMDFSLPYILDGGATVNLGTLLGLSPPASLVPPAAVSAFIIVLFVLPAVRGGRCERLGPAAIALYALCAALFLLMVFQLVYFRNRDDSVTYAMRGRAHEIHGNRDTAELYFVSSLAADPDGPFSLHVLQSLINLTAQSGDGERAMRLRGIFELSAQIRSHPERSDLRAARSRLFRASRMTGATVKGEGGGV